MSTGSPAGSGSIHEDEEISAIRYKHHDRGFTLIEVLVAFSIAALALGVLFQIYAKGTASAILGKEYNEALMVAESRLATLGITESLETMELSGTESDRYQWQITLRDYEQPDPSVVMPLTLKQVTLQVSWESKGKRRDITLHTLKPMPAS